MRRIGGGQFLWYFGKRRVRFVSGENIAILCGFVRYGCLAGQDETRSLAKTVMDGRQRAGKLHACVALAKISETKPRERDLKL